MFEKEAEEWIKTKGTDAMTCLKENIGWDEVCNQAFKDGAEFGYNKAKEEAEDIINELLIDGYDESTRKKALDFLYLGNEE